MNVTSRIPPEADGFVPAGRSDPNDPPLSGASARKPHSDEEFDFRRDEELLERDRDPIRNRLYPWA